MSELKPCPFCGGKARITLEEEDKPNECFHNVYCKSCDAQFWVNSKSMAIEKWNTRPDNWIKFETDEIDGVSKFTNPIPDDEQRVLVTNGIDVWEDVFLNEGECYFDSGLGIFDNITHWQPLSPTTERILI